MNIVIAGGGTGGHLFPGVSLAQEFLRRDPAAAVLFMGTQAGIESRVLPGLGFSLATVQVSGFKGKPALQKALSLASVPRSIAQAAGILRRHRADFVLGMGGYISFPAIAAARLLGLPCAIHEQNSVPGLANRWLARIVDRVFISYEASRPCFPSGTTLCTGMPVRMPQAATPESAGAGRFCIFVCGGSQGARAVNEAMIGALDSLEPLKAGLRFVHQTGRADESMVRAAYEARGFEAQVSAFIDDMYACYGGAGLVVSRAGASTLAEIALCGRPSILLPYPYAAGNHQEFNARAFVDAGAALMLAARELSGQALGRAIRSLVDDRARLAAMARQARGCAKPDAAAEAVAECMRLIASRKEATP